MVVVMVTCHTIPVTSSRLFSQAEVTGAACNVVPRVARVATGVEML